MPGRILVADDSANIREVLQMNLETLGYEVLLATDGDQALEKVYRENPDLLILDVMMPRQNGFQVCRKVKADPRHGSTPVILLTAKSQREDVYWGKDCGADEYMTKPFSTKELEVMVERLLSRRAGVQTRQSGTLEDEVERRRAAGDPGALCEVRWNRRAMDVYRKKHGELEYAKSVEALRREARGFLDSEPGDGRLELVDTYGFRIVLSGTRDEIEDLSQELCTRLSRLARTFYSATDRQRKGIPIRDFKTGKIETVPLVSFTAEVSYYGG
jgi:DNA-binding response OmpR family regulator